MQLSHHSRYLLLRGFPLVGLVELQSPMGQVAGGTRRLSVFGAGQLCIGILYFPQNRAVGVVDDVDDGGILRHVLERFDRLINDDITLKIWSQLDLVETLRGWC